jgi:hypothetical protein
METIKNEPLGQGRCKWPNDCLEGLVPSFVPTGLSQLGWPDALGRGAEL